MGEIKYASINDEEIIEISLAMRTQNHRGTQYPLFVIQEQKEVVAAEGCGDRIVYINNDGERITAEEFEGFDKDGFDFTSEFRRIEVSDEWVINHNAGVFLTERACENHIKFNGYHYSKPRSYVISAWRNPEMVVIMRAILKLTGEQIPEQYK